MPDSVKRRILPRRLNSIFYLLLIVLLINMIPMYMLSQSMYSRARDTLTRSTVNSKLDWEQWLMENINQQLTMLWQVQYAACLSRSTTIVRLTGTSAFSEAEFRNAKLDLQKQLNIIGAGRDYIDSACVYFPEMGIAITHGAVDYQIPDKTLTLLSELYQAKRDTIAFSGGKLYLIANTTQSVVYAKTRLPAVICVSVISPEKLFPAINNKADITDRRILLMENESGGILYSSAPDASDARVSEMAMGSPQNATGYDSMTFEGREQLVFYYRCAPIGMTLLEVVDYAALFTEISALESLYSTLLIMLILLNTVVITVLYFMIYNPARSLVEGFSRSAKGELGLQLKTRHLADEFRDIFEGFNGMSKSIRQMVDRDYAQRLLMQSAELKQLQLQINPHFLYNSFFILRSMLRNEDYDTAERMCQMMGDYLKYITKTDETDATLEREFAHARAYAGIQLIRFARSVSVEICELPTDLKSAHVPKLILQPLLENAFLHGMKDVIEGGRIRVRISRENGMLYLYVEDNGKNITDASILAIREAVYGFGPGGNGIALNNIHNRIRLQFGEGSGLTVSRSELGGLMLTLVIGGVQNV